MIDINIEAGVAGKVSAQVYTKDDHGNPIPVEGENKSASTCNIITQLGLDAIDPASLTPSFPTNHYIALGEGTQPETLGVTHLVNPKTVSPALPVYTTNGTWGGKARRAIKAPADKINDPTLHTITVWYEFGMPGTARNYSEVGLVSSNNISGTDKYTAYTYTLFRDAQGDPTTIAVATNEYILISYTYQVQVMLHYPVSVPVTGSGIPAGLTACVYRRDEAQYQSGSYTSVGIYYYQTMDDFNNSGWAANFDKFHHPDGNLFPSSTYPRNLIQYGLFQATAGGNSIGRPGVTIDPDYLQYSTASRSISSTVMNVTVAQGKFHASIDTPRFIVSWGCSSSSSLVTFSAPISFVPKYDKVQFVVTINYSSANQPWIDPATV